MTLKELVQAKQESLEAFLRRAYSFLDAEYKPGLLLNIEEDMDVFLDVCPETRVTLYIAKATAKPGRLYVSVHSSKSMAEVSGYV